MLNIMNPPADWSTMKKLIWLRGTPINGGEELTVSGTPPLTLHNSLGKPLKAWSVDVLPKQDLNGYDAPWPAGGGKNKLNPANFLQATVRGVTIKNNNDGSITLNGTAEALFRTGIYSVQADGTYILNGCPSGGGSNSYQLDITRGDATLAGSTDAGNGSPVIELQTGDIISIRVANGQAFNNFVMWPMLRLSTESDASWTPYSNICPIHGTDKVTIATAGKNLFDINNPLFTAGSQYNLNNYASKVEDGKLYNGGQIGASGGSGITIPAEAGQYTLSFTVNGEYAKAEVRAVTIGNDGIWTSNTTIYSDQSATGILGDANITVTFPAGYTHMFFAAYSATKYGSWETNVQIEFGSVATEYTPFSGIYSTVITLPQPVYTATISEQGGESRSVEIDMGEQNWLYHEGRDVFYYVTPDGKPTGTGRSGYGMCEAYKVMEGAGYASLIDGQMAVGTNFSSAQTASIVVKDTRFTDAGQFKTAVSGIKLVYEIADSTTFAVPSVTIPTPTGTATTWATAKDGTVDSMSVTYVGKA